MGGRAKEMRMLGGKSSFYLGETEDKTWGTGGNLGRAGGGIRSGTGSSNTGISKWIILSSIENDHFENDSKKQKTVSSLQQRGST